MNCNNTRYLVYGDLAAVRLVEVLEAGLETESPGADLILEAF